MTKITYYDRIRLRAIDAPDSSEDSELLIQIVPAHEADITSGRISVDAPVAQAVLHRRVGDKITVRAQGKPIPMRIIEVEKHLKSA
jgi:transcription elongation factor GreA